MGQMGGKGLVNEGWKGEEVPVDEEGIGGKQSYLSFPGGPTTTARRRCREVFLAVPTGAFRPNIQGR
jgi:hypothetical protein